MSFSDDVKRFHLKEYPDNKYVLLFLRRSFYSRSLSIIMDTNLMGQE